MTLEPSSPLLLYHQLERVLAERIAARRYRDGFHGDHELAAEFSGSRPPGATWAESPSGALKSVMSR